MSDLDDRLWRVPDAGPAPLEEDVRCDVAVVGAGLTGLTAAAVLAGAGLDVRVLEARQVGAGTTGGSTAKVSLAQGLRFSRLAAHHDGTVLAGYAEANRRGQEWVRELAARRRVPHDVRDGVSYSTGSRGRSDLEQELDAMRAAGLRPQLRNDAGLPYPTTGALVLPDQLQVDAGQYLGALVREAQAAGARVHAGTTVTGATLRGPLRLTCTSAGGEGSLEAEPSSPVRSVSAGTVVVATNMPFLDRGGFFARQEPLRSYCVAVRVRGPRPQGMYLSVDGPTRSVRTAGEDLLVVGGNGHVVGRASDTDERLDDLEAFARRHFDVAEVTHRWGAQDHETADLLPFVGRLVPWRQDVLVATGFAKWGFTSGTAAGLACAATVLGRDVGPVDAWDPWRADAVSQARRFVGFNASVAARLTGGWARAMLPVPQGPVGEGEGRVVPSTRGPVAVSRVDGRVCSVSAVCTHLGGVLRWNPAERSWDCPLHGSRFAPDGRWLEGPATSDLPTRDDDAARPTD